MKTRIPLVATFLMTASIAVAGSISRPSIPGPGILEDPAGPFGSAQLLGNSPDVQWASPSCSTIGCPTVGNRVPQEGDPDFIGPIRPPKTDDAALDKAIADQKSLSPDDTYIKLGDGTFAQIFKDGSIAINTANMCGIPKSPEEAKKNNPALVAALAQLEEKKLEKEKMDSSINGGRDSINEPGNKKSTPPGGHMASMTSGSDSNGGNQDTGGNAGSNDGNDLGEGLGAMNDTGTSSAGTGIGTDGSSGGLGASGEVKVGKIDGAVAKAEAEKSEGYTYNAIRAAAQNSARVGEGVKAAFADPHNAGRPNVDDTYGDGKEVGKTQASANGDAR